MTVRDFARGGTAGSGLNGKVWGSGGAASSEARGLGAGASLVDVAASATSGDGRRAGVATAKAYGASTGGGDVWVSATQQAGLSTARDEAATASVMQDAVSGSTRGKLRLTQRSVGSQGSAPVAGAGSDAGKGGDASSLVRASNAGGGALELTSVAEGGAGKSLFGSAGDAVRAASGGDAAATAEGEDANGSAVSVSAKATGGRGGNGIGGVPGGTGGAASATARARGVGRAEAGALAVAGDTGVGELAHAVARAEACGASGAAVSEARTPVYGGSRALPPGEGGLLLPMRMIATVEAEGVARSASEISFATGPLPVFRDADLEARAFAIAAPDAATIAAALEGDPRVSAGLDREGHARALALMTLEAGGSPGPTGARVQRARAEIPDIYRQGLPDTRNFAIGLLDPSADGAGFDALRFHIGFGNTSLFERSFDSQALALSFFDDHLIDLGPLAQVALPPGQTATLSFEIELENAAPGSGFLTSFLFAEATPVPEAGSAALLGAGLAVLGRARRRAS